MPLHDSFTARVLLVAGMGIALAACAGLRPMQKGIFMNDERQPIAVNEEAAIPIVEEQARIEKRSVVTGRVGIKKTVTQDEVLLEDTLVQEDVRVERVPVGRFVEEAVPVRYEGDTLIVPVLEEVPVVVKRLRLKEELHITRERRQEPYTAPVHVRREDVSVERQRGKSPRQRPSENPERSKHPEAEEQSESEGGRRK